MTPSDAKVTPRF